LPFLADIFVTAPRDTIVAWIGLRRETLELFANVWHALGFTQTVVVDEERVRDAGFAVAPGASVVSSEVLLAKADAFVVDFGAPDGAGGPRKIGNLSSAERRAISRAFLDIVSAERSRQID